MANEAVVEVVEEEVDIISLITPDLEAAEEEELDEVVSDEVPDTVEELQALLKLEREKIGKRNKTIKKGKQAMHRMQDESKDLLQRLDRLDQKVGDLQPNPGTEKNDQEDQEWRDRYDNDNSQALDYTDHKNSRLEGKVADYLVLLEQRFNEKIEAIQSASNPNLIKYQDKIDALRRNPKFADFDDDTMLTLAMELDGAKIKRPPAAIGGGRRANKIPETTVKASAEEIKLMGF